MLQLSCMCSSTLKHLSIIIPDTISEDALKAAQNFVEVCNQYAAYLAGRGEISTAIEAINTIEKGTCTHKHSR